MTGSKEDVETVRAFFQDPRARGLGDPLLVASGGRRGSSGRSKNASRDRRANAATDAQPRGQGLGGSVAEVQGAGHCLSSSATARRLAAGIRADYANVLPSALAVSKTISTPASPTCGCQSRTAVSFRAVKISLLDANFSLLQNCDTLSQIYILYKLSQHWAPRPIATLPRLRQYSGNKGASWGGELSCGITGRTEGRKAREIPGGLVCPFGEGPFLTASRGH